MTAIGDIKGDTRSLNYSSYAQDREYSKDPNIKALKRRGFINHGSTLGGFR